MKRILFLSTLATFAIISCKKKEYACHCEGENTAYTSIRIEAASKKKAENKCETYNTPPGSINGFHDCKLQ